jgi:hypothetical protein
LVKISVGRVVWIFAFAASWKGVLVRHLAYRVATWLGVILDAPDLSLPEAVGDDPRMRAALAVAEAEARVETAERGSHKAMTLEPDWDADPVLAALRREVQGATTEKQIKELLMNHLRSRDFPEAVLYHHLGQPITRELPARWAQRRFDPSRSRATSRAGGE